MNRFGLGDAMDVPYPQVTGTYQLSQASINDLLDRNPALAQIISDAITYHTIDLSIGYSFTDSVYGNVLISVDANGHLVVVGNSPVDPSQITTQPPNLPPGPPLCTDSLEAFLKCIEKYALWVLVGLGAYLYYEHRR